MKTKIISYFEKLTKEKMQVKVWRYLRCWERKFIEKKGNGVECTSSLMVKKAIAIVIFYSRI